MEGPQPAAEAAGGGAHTLIRLENGEIWAFGANGVGQLGLPWATLEDQHDWSVPAKVDGPPSG